MKRAGEILREHRLKEGLSLEEVSNMTKVKVEYLHDIEEGQYQKLPEHIYTQGFIQSFAHAVNLESGQVLPFYRRERKDLFNTVKETRSIPQPIEKKRINITSERLFTGLITLGLASFLVFLFLQYRSFAGTPVLVVDSPPNNLTTSEQSIIVSGVTDVDVSIAINGTEVTKSVDGSFSLSYQLNQGVNRIRIVASNKLGKKTVEERVVEYTTSGLD